MSKNKFCDDFSITFCGISKLYCEINIVKSCICFDCNCEKRFFHDFGFKHIEFLNMEMLKFVKEHNLNEDIFKEKFNNAVSNSMVGRLNSMVERLGWLEEKCNESNWFNNTLLYLVVAYLAYPPVTNLIKMIWSVYGE